MIEISRIFFENLRNTAVAISVSVATLFLVQTKNGLGPWMMLMGHVLTAIFLVVSNSVSFSLLLEKFVPQRLGHKFLWVIAFVSYTFFTLILWVLAQGNFLSGHAAKCIS